MCSGSSEELNAVDKRASFVRLGKRASFVRLGKRASFVRLGKRYSSDSAEDVEQPVSSPLELVNYNADYKSFVSTNVFIKLKYCVQLVAHSQITTLQNAGEVDKRASFVRLGKRASFVRLG